MLGNLKRFSTHSTWFYLTVILVTTITYMRGIPNLFVAEDFHNVNDFSISFSALQHYLLNSSRVKVIGFGFEWILSQLFGTQPAGYHVVLIMIHILVVIVLSLLMTKLFKNKNLALVICLVFAVYPRNHQAVLWYAALHFSMVTLAILITVLAFLLYLETSKKRWQLLGLVSFTAGLMIHEASIFTIPLLFLIEVLIVDHPLGYKRVLKPDFWAKYIPYLGLFALYFLVNFTGLRAFRLTGGPPPAELISVGGTGETYGLNPFNATMIKEWLGYLTYSLFPHIPLRSLELGSIVSYIITGVALLAYSAALIKGDRVVKFGAAWVIVTTLPFVMFVPFGNADRYFYLLAVGFAIMVGGLVRIVYRKYNTSKWMMQLGIGLLGIYLVSSVLLTQVRIDEWRQAGIIADDYITQVVNLVPNPEPGSYFLLVNPPAYYGEVYIFLGGGMSGALPLRYNKAIPDLQIYHSSAPEVIRNVEQERLTSLRLPNIHLLLYKDGKVIDKSYLSFDIQTLNPINWTKG